MILLLKLALLAHYLDASGASHELHMWRDGDRVRRDTDGQLQIFVEDDRYQVIDLARGRAYRAHRASLARIGSFPDRELLGSLALPPPKALGRDKTPVGSCRWYGDADKRVCWSEKWKVALLVRERHGEDWHETLRVERIEPKFSEDVFHPQPGKLIEMDLDADVND
jgi:hypothetical protein